MSAVTETSTSHSTEPAEAMAPSRGWSLQKAALWATVIAAVAAVFAILLMLRDDGRSDDGGCVIYNEGVMEGIQCSRVEIPPEKLFEDEVIAEAEQFRDTEPRGTGPWPFVVTRDDNIGLKLRTTNVLEGVHIGGLAHLQTAWVVCKAHSGFDPEGHGDVWYKVKWSNQAPSMDFFQSDPGAATTGWAHAYYLTPYRHNGDVPDCA